MDKMNDEKKVIDNKILTANPFITLLTFAVPIILGNAFQQLYNIVDAIVAGKYLGDNPLGAISVCAPFTDIIYALMIGATIGTGVLIAKNYGAKSFENLREVFSTALVSGLIFSFILMALGFIFASSIIKGQGNEEIICELSVKYLYILFLGLPFCFLYNFFASFLRSCGNSRVPFAVLLLSCVLNVGLDILFVSLLKMGIEGVAIATVLCQLFSAFCCICFTYYKYNSLVVNPKKLRISSFQLKKVISYSWGASMQQSVVCIGRLLVQGFLTSLGIWTVTGYNMSLRAEGFVFCFSSGISASAVVCISQNLGAKNFKRMKDFYFCALSAGVALALLTGGIFTLYPEKIVGIFSKNQQVISAGVLYLSTMAFVYITAFINEITQGFFRGLGRINLTMVCSLLQVLLRVVLAFVLVKEYQIKGICISVASGWILMTLFEGTYAMYCVKKLGKNVQSDTI